MLVVLSIISLLISLFSGMTLYRRSVYSPYYQAVLVAQDLRQAYALARENGRSVDVKFNVSDRRWIGPSGNGHELPNGTEIDVTSVRVDGETGGNTVRFFPDGTSSGGSITLSRGSQVARIGVDWLTGRVGIDRDSQSSQ